jgi:steroid delta-isomerase-like uncharacterized protein
MPEQATAPAAAEPLSQEHARDLFRRWYEVLNARDPKRVAEVFTEDVVFVDDAWPETVRGHGEMKRFLGAIWTAFPDFRFELVEAYPGADGATAAAHVRVSGSMDGPLDPPGFAPTGRRLATDYGGFYEIDGERIRRGRIIVNMNDAAVQLGALPPPGSRGERAAVMVQRLQARLMRRRG